MYMCLMSAIRYVRVGHIKSISIYLSRSHMSNADKLLYSKLFVTCMCLVTANKHVRGGRIHSIHNTLGHLRISSDMRNSSIKSIEYAANSWNMITREQNEEGEAALQEGGALQGGSGRSERAVRHEQSHQNPHGLSTRPSSSSSEP